MNLNLNQIKEISMNRLKELYGEHIPKTNLERYNAEMEIIYNNHYENIYTLVYLIVKKAQEDKVFIMARSNISSSFIAYLLGISIINPIQYKLPFETFINSERISIILNFPKEYIKTIYNYIIGLIEESKIYEKGEDFYLIEYKNCHIWLSELEEMTILRKLEETTKINHNSIDIENNKLIEYIINNSSQKETTANLFEFDNIYYKKIISKVKPQNLEELVKISTLCHGTNVWNNNNEKLIENHSINELACSKEDIYLYLVGKGIKKECAYQIIETISNGNVLTNKEEWELLTTIMKKNNIPEWYITSLERMKYVHSKASSYNTTILTLWLIWYEMNYTTVFNQIVNELETITFEQVEERLKNVPLEQYTKQDILDRFIAYGTEEELNSPEIQKLLIKHGYIQELLEMTTNIDNEVMEEIFKVTKDNQATDQYCIQENEDTTIWDLTDNIGAKEKDKALQILEELIKKNEPLLKLLNTLKLTLERVYMCKIAMLQRKDISTVLALKPNQKFLISKYVKHSNNFTQEELERILKALENLKELYLNNIEKFDLKTGLRNIINNLEPIKSSIPLLAESKYKPEYIDIITGNEYIDKVINIDKDKRSKLVIIGGTNETDRTNLALNIAKNTLEQDKSVLYFSLGVSMETIKSNKILSNLDTLRIYSFDERGAEELGQNNTTSITKGLYINDMPIIPIEDIEKISYKAKLEIGIKMIIIDYIQLVTRIRNNNSMSSEQVQEEIILLLKSLTQNFDIPIILLSQISEKADTRDKPILQDFPISKHLQDSVDIVISTYRSNNNKDTELLLLNEGAKEYKHIANFGDIIDTTIHKPLESLTKQEIYDRYILYRLYI